MGSIDTGGIDLKIGMGHVFYVNSANQAVGIDGAIVEAAGPCNAGIPLCNGQVYSFRARTHDKGIFNYSDFNLVPGIGTAIQLGWYKPSVRVVVLPAGLPAALTGPVAVNCATGGDTTAGNNQFCSDPESVCSAGNIYYEHCNLKGQGLTKANFDFKYSR